MSIDPRVLVSITLITVDAAGGKHLSDLGERQLFLVPRKGDSLIFEGGKRDVYRVAKVTWEMPALTYTVPRQVAHIYVERA